MLCILVDIWIALDNWKLGKTNINLLVLGVAYKGMPTPLLWDFLTIEEEIDKDTITKRGKIGLY